MTYFGALIDQCNGGEQLYGAICWMDALKENLAMNCIPESNFRKELNDYDEFLRERRRLMAWKMRDYYHSL